MPNLVRDMPGRLSDSPCRWGGAVALQRAVAALMLLCVPQRGIAQAPDEAHAKGERSAAATQPAATQPVALQIPFDVRHNSALTGDWWGARAWLKERGIEFGLSLNTQYQGNVHGGERTRSAHRVTGSGDYELTLDFEKMGVLKGGTFYCLAESVFGDDVGLDRVGALFGTNADAIGETAILARQVWYEQKLFDGKARVRAGRLSVFTDFDTNAFANSEDYQFLNPALVNTFNMPVPADGLGEGLGAQVVIQPAEWVYFGAIAMDARSDAHNGGFHTAFHDEDYFFFAWELGFLPVWKLPWGKLPGGYRFGLWYDPQPKAKFFDDLGGRRRTIPLKRDDTGFYVNLDQMLVREKPGDESDTQGLGVFFRYGYAPANVNLLEHFWSVGAQYQGLIPTRDEDVLGFGFAQGLIGGPSRRLDGGSQEAVYELYYNIKLLPWLQLSPDLQYVVNPGARGGRDAFVIGLRLLAMF